MATVFGVYFIKIWLSMKRDNKDFVSQKRRCKLTCMYMYQDFSRRPFPWCVRRHDFKSNLSRQRHRPMVPLVVQHAVLTKSNPYAIKEAHFSRRVQRVWCALPARFTSHLLLECRALYVYNICAGCCFGSMWHTLRCALLTRLSRVCHPFMYCRCRALLARRKCAGPWVTFGQYW
jgi:hypothetical protein